MTSVPDLEPNSIGSYDDTVLGALDKVLEKLVAKGIKAIISPHDGNAFGYNSCDVYGKAYGCAQSDSAADGFYSSTTAKQQCVSWRILPYLLLTPIDMTTAWPMC